MCQGEVALMFERDDQTSKIEIVGYALPKNKTSFGPAELRDAYLAQAVDQTHMEDNEKGKIYKYFQQSRW